MKKRRGGKKKKRKIETNNVARKKTKKKKVIGEGTRESPSRGDAERDYRGRNILDSPAALRNRGFMKAAEIGDKRDNS